MWEMSKRVRKNNEKLWLVGVDTAKETLMERLKNGDREAAGYIHIPDLGPYANEFASQLLSEYRDLVFVNGRPTHKWTRKPSARAEVLDCYVYASSVRSSLSPNWDKRRADLTRIPEAEIIPAGGAAPKTGGWAAFNN
jgi:phage terminase large subunit GpA-like protein